MAGSEPRKAGDVFDLKRLRDLIELMNQYDLMEVDLKQEKQRIRLSKGGGLVAPAPLAMPASAATPLPPSDLVGSESGASSDDSDNRVTIDSPMVGTFYTKPNPDAGDFVKVGDHVGPETIVCIVEAMKVFNEIQAEVSGKIVAVLVKNEESVDFGRPLFKVDTGG
jgi:acetyl-CoA carboxylase biotin carboxyl carrier protein